jgi:hypothetical protein
MNYWTSRYFRYLSAIGLASILAMCPPLQAASISLSDILGSYAFTPGNMAAGNVSLNMWDDVTGAFLTTNNGDAPDITISYTSVVPGVLPSGTTIATMAYSTAGAGEITATHAYTQGASAGFPATNNPGTRIINKFRLTFASHLTVNNLQIDLRSLNTAGVVWEVSQLAYLKPDGSYYTPAPVISPYLTHTPVNGQPSQGWFQLDSKGTVNNVGSTPTTAGASGTFENLTATNGNGYLDYTDLGLPALTQVGGFEWITFLEDTRGTTNTSASLTATLESITVGGNIVLPEPSALALIACATLLTTRRRPSASRH